MNAADITPDDHVLWFESKAGERISHRVITVTPLDAETVQLVMRSPYGGKKTWRGAHDATIDLADD